MKKIILVVAAAAAVIAQSCTKDSINPAQDRAMLETGREICFSTTGIEVNTSTKVTAVTNENISSFNLLTNNGAADAQSYLWTATASRVGTTPTFQTGRYWPNSNPSYHFYASNAALTSVANGATVTADGTLDVVCGYVENPNFNGLNLLNFIHIYSRIADISVTSSKGYTISGLSLVLKNAKTGGVYNVGAESWSNCTVVENATLIEGTNDYYIVPGTYTINIDYTFTKGDYTASFSKTADVTLTGGKNNNIAITLTADPAVPVNFTVRVYDWEIQNIPLSVS